MLFFIDESWQSTPDQQYKAGVLSAIALQSQDFNSISQQVRGLKQRWLGFQAADLELKGAKLLQRYYFRLEQRGVDSSQQLNLARGIFALCKTMGIKSFASITFEQSEIDLACANQNQLERPFFFLFERINQFMKESFPHLTAMIVFDDRGVATNERISKSVSNFFHKSSVGKTFDHILKVPFFAISTENIGIQITDLVGHVIGRRFTGDRSAHEFFELAKEMQFRGDEKMVNAEGKTFTLRGWKVVKPRSGALPDLVQE